MKNCDQKLKEAEEKYETLLDKYRKSKELLKIGIKSTDRYENEMKALKEQVKSNKMPSSYISKIPKRKEQLEVMMSVLPLYRTQIATLELEVQTIEKEVNIQEQEVKKLRENLQMAQQQTQEVLQHNREITAEVFKLWQEKTSLQQEITSLKHTIFSKETQKIK